MLNSSHWGIYRPIVRGQRVEGVEPFDRDPAPSDLIKSIPTATHHRSRIRAPAVRQSWLEDGPGAGRVRRGGDRFIEVGWDVALDLVAGALRHTIDAYGNQAIFGGSYGWASAGRFHHAKSQIRRFLNTIGGFTDSVDSYSNAAGMAVARHALGSETAIDGPGTSWSGIVRHARLVVMFGGLPLRNLQITVGGLGEHTTAEHLREARAAGITFVNVSPCRDDAASFLEADWIAPRPGSDTALILALTHTLVAEGLHDRDFVATRTSGFDAYAAYLLGHTDGTPKDADWASVLTDVPASVIRDLARRMAATPTFIVCNWSLQRADHGEQPFWGIIALAAALGQIGRPGTGFGFGYGSLEGLGGQRRSVSRPTLPTFDNQVRSFIPVARLSDMLLHPGEPVQYDGRSFPYPRIDLIYWCGGNPFHHHQDLNRLIAAWRLPRAVIVHECWWTATARHADIVLPATTTLERNDIGATALDRFVVAMKQAIPPVGEARNDYDIFGSLAGRLGVADAFTEGLDEMGHLRRMYGRMRDREADGPFTWPDFEAFWRLNVVEIPAAPAPHVLLDRFADAPDDHPLATPSGRILIGSERIAGWGLPDCPPYPAWIEPIEWLGGAAAARHPLHLLTVQPSTRLHGQLDMSEVSQASKIQGREPIRLNPADAARRAIAAGMIVRVFNDRGATLAGAVLTEALRPGVVQMATGAWYDPVEPGRIGSLDRHGQVNVLTADRGTSRWAQGCSAQSTLVEVEPFTGTLPPITAYEPPLVHPQNEEDSVTEAAKLGSR